LNKTLPIMLFGVVFVVATSWRSVTAAVIVAVSGG